MFNLFGALVSLSLFFPPELWIPLSAAKNNNNSVRFRGFLLLFTKVRYKSGLIFKGRSPPPLAGPVGPLGVAESESPRRGILARGLERLLQNKIWFHFPTPRPGNPEDGRTWPGMEDLGIIREEGGS